MGSICIWSSISTRNSIRSIMTKVPIKFINKILSPNRLSTSSISIRITSLNHKTFNYSMEYMSIIISILCMCCKVFNSKRSYISKKLNCNISSSCSNNSYWTYTSSFWCNCNTLFFTSWFFIINITSCSGISNYYWNCLILLVDDLNCEMEKKEKKTLLYQ